MDLVKHFAEAPLDIIGPLRFGRIVPNPVRFIEGFQEGALALYDAIDRVLFLACFFLLFSLRFHNESIRGCLLDQPRKVRISWMGTAAAGNRVVDVPDSAHFRS